VAEKDRKPIQRCGHGAAVVTVASDCVEVILFGGRNNDRLLIADTVAARFGEYLDFSLAIGNQNRN